MYYVYEDHLSADFYITEYEQDYEQCYCEQCGDSDWLVGTFGTEEESIQYIEDIRNEYDY